MTPKTRKRALVWGLALLVVVGAFVGYRVWRHQQTALPPGITSGNGRIEAQLVDVSAKEPLRVAEVLVKEGDLVRPGQVVARMDTTTLEATLAGAQANISAAEEQVAAAQASIVKTESEIELARIERSRARRLVREGAGAQRELDVRKTKLLTLEAALEEANAMLETATKKVEVAEAEAKTVQTRIDDATLKSPVTGRVLYRLAEVGEVLAAGGKVLTLINLEDVYMEIFVPSEEAARLKIGAEARITVDYEPDRSIAGYVSFVSPEAQFTPKQVETKTEREKLMFRVKIQVPSETATRYVERIKTGVRGVGYVKIDEAAEWPARLKGAIGPRAQAP